jgi:hypothetical protein
MSGYLRPRPLVDPQLALLHITLSNLYESDAVLSQDVSGHSVAISSQANYTDRATAAASADCCG